MKGFAKIILFGLLLMSLSVGVMAASEAKDVQYMATVGEDGSCIVSVTVRLHLDAAATGLTFPLPADAQDVLLGGSPAATSVSGGKLWLNLPELSAGDHYFTVNYRLPAVVSREDDEALVTIPVLSGFAYPISSLEFSVTLPGDISGTPTVSSGYYQGDIADSVTMEVHGNTLSGTVTQPLKDHETLHLALSADTVLFPQVSFREPWLDFWDWAALVCMILGVLYYLLTLTSRFVPPARCFTMPDGISAGEVGVFLTGTGADLTLMVLSWAQMGYLQLELREKRKVILHKQMEMGNERSQFEMHIFQALFGKRQTVDGTGMHYARLCRQTATQAPLKRQLFHPKSGKPMIFLALTCAAGLCSGAKLGLALAEHPVLQVLMTIIMSALCAVLSYFIQSGIKRLPLRGKGALWFALVCCGGWIVLGNLAGMIGTAIAMVAFQLLCGFVSAYGGRRSELGKRGVAQIRGLRRYMVRASTYELQQRLQANGNYFYELAPYALALGLDMRFARRFDKAPLPECGFLVMRQRQPETAAQWAALQRKIFAALNARQKRLLFEHITGRS